MPKAGENIRELARERRTEALKHLAFSVYLAIAPLIMPLPAGLKTLFLIGCWVGAFVLYQKAQYLLLRANLADQGAEGEETVAQLLKPLECQGWEIEYNIPLSRWGDADAFLRSPKGNCFVVDTKTNKGGIFYDGAVLMLRYGKQIHEFSNDKNILKAVKGQARAIKEIKQVKFVQPVLCFTQANLSGINQNNMIDGVYVVDTINLLKLLNQFESK